MKHFKSLGRSLVLTYFDSLFFLGWRNGVIKGIGDHYGLNIGKHSRICPYKRLEVGLLNHFIYKNPPTNKFLSI